MLSKLGMSSKGTPPYLKVFSAYDFASHINHQLANVGIMVKKQKDLESTTYTWEMCLETLKICCFCKLFFFNSFLMATLKEAIFETD